MSDQIKHWHVTYNDIHNLIRKSTPNIVLQFNPDLLIAIGGGSAAPIFSIYFVTERTLEAFSQHESW
jgi:hypoxanthine phosphoribosyltransferase